MFILVAMLPCTKLWPWIGTQMDFSKCGVYRSWAQRKFRHVPPNTRLESMINGQFKPGTEYSDSAAVVFKTCMEFETDYFF